MLIWILPGQDRLDIGKATEDINYWLSFFHSKRHLLDSKMMVYVYFHYIKYSDLESERSFWSFKKWGESEEQGIFQICILICYFCHSEFCNGTYNPNYFYDSKYQQVTKKKKPTVVTSTYSVKQKSTHTLLFQTHLWNYFHPI